MKIPSIFQVTARFAPVLCWLAAGCVTSAPVRDITPVLPSGQGTPGPVTDLGRRLLKSTRLKKATLAPEEKEQFKRALAVGMELAASPGVTQITGPLAEAYDVAFDYNQDLTESAGCHYRSHVIRSGDTLISYLLPVWNKQEVYFGGGIKALLLAEDISLLESKRMHKEIVNLTRGFLEEVLFRTLEADPVPNEVDLAQTIQATQFAKIQYLKTKTYWFIAETLEPGGTPNFMFYHAPADSSE